MSACADGPATCRISASLDEPRLLEQRALLLEPRQVVLRVVARRAQVKVVAAVAVGAGPRDGELGEDVAGGGWGVGEAGAARTLGQAVCRHALK